MNIDGEELNESVSVADAKLINLISLKDDAASSGLTLAIGLSDGKLSKAMFDSFSSFPGIIIEAFSYGFQIIGVLHDKETKAIDTTVYNTFKKGKFAEYFFFPGNVKNADGTIPTSLSFYIPTAQINTALKKSKATTIMRFEWNINNPSMILYIINGPSTIPYVLDSKYILPYVCPLPSDLSNPLLEPNFGMTVELFSTAMSTVSVKFNNHEYDFVLTIHPNGISIQTKAPGVGKLSYGNTSEPGIEFLNSNATAKYFSKIHKITPRGTVLITALDKNMYKVTLPVGSCADGYIFKYPKPVSFVVQNQSIPQLQYGQINQQNNKQITYTPQNMLRQITQQPQQAIQNQVRYTF